MRKINRFKIHGLRVEEFFGFLKKVENETQLLVLESDTKMVDEFKAAVSAFDEALKMNAKNSMTEQVLAADARTDEAWRTLSQLVKVLSNHPTEAVAEAAREVSTIMQKYGDITGMAYNEEYGNLHNALQELEGVDAAKQKLVMADALVAELQAGYKAFMSASSERDAEEAKKQVGIVKKTRSAAEAAYRTLVDRVNALAVVNGEAEYADFIDRVNEIVAAAKATLAARKTRNDKKKEKE